ncbi:trace amine-associated receptor 8c-like [Ruditapes philippinarum]|uniref:trace amine-associated receptor 8c-like n=1 Tax=Ruditapes philippinarum TaxID=129788 RepID=UPI00295AD081|nr:trace amine-associated receptor 8c-like [Ruditapes philippinarum]
MDDKSMSKYSEHYFTLQELNDAEVKTLIPTVVFLIFISVTGLAGNSLALYVYKTKFTYSNIQCFLLCLSALDFFSCTVAIPFEISTILQQYTYESGWRCQLARFFNTFSTNSSAFLLVFIAFERFRKVCKPLEWQIKTTVTIGLCISSIVLGIIVALPAIFVYGKHTFHIPEVNLTGSECSVINGAKEASLPFLYFLTFGVLFVTATVTMTILYCMIGQKLRKQAAKINKTLGRSDLQPKESGCPHLKAAANMLRARKTSFLMFLLTIAFILSFFPHLALVSIRLTKKGFVEGLSDRNKAVYKFFLRSYFLNCAINPIIYGVCDPRFKNAVKEMLARRSCKQCKSTTQFNNI